MSINGLVLSITLSNFALFLWSYIYIYVVNPRPYAKPDFNLKVILFNQDLYNSEDWIEFLKSSIPIALGLLLDEGTYEVTSLIVGLLNDPILIAVHVSLINSL